MKFAIYMAELLTVTKVYLVKKNPLQLRRCGIFRPLFFFAHRVYDHVSPVPCRVDVDRWSNLITSLLQQSRDTCMWMVEFLATDGNSCIK